MDNDFVDKINAIEPGEPETKQRKQALNDMFAALDDLSEEEKIVLTSGLIETVGKERVRKVKLGLIALIAHLLK